MGTMMSQQEAKRAQIMELLTAGNSYLKMQKLNSDF